MYGTFGEYADEFDTSIYPKGGFTIKALNVETGGGAGIASMTM